MPSIFRLVVSATLYALILANRAFATEAPPPKLVHQFCQEISTRPAGSFFSAREWSDLTERLREASIAPAPTISANPAFQSCVVRYQESFETADFLRNGSEQVERLLAVAEEVPDLLSELNVRKREYDRKWQEFFSGLRLQMHATSRH